MGVIIRQESVGYLKSIEIEEQKGGPGSGVRGHRTQRNEQARTAPAREAKSIASKHNFKKISGVFNDQDTVYFEGPAVNVPGLSNSIKKAGYKQIPTNSRTPVTGGKVPSILYEKRVPTSDGTGMRVFAKIGVNNNKGFFIWHGSGIIAGK